MGEAGNTMWGKVQTILESGFHPGCFTERCFYLQVLVHREGPSHRDGFTQRDEFTKGCLYLQVLLHRGTFYKSLSELHSARNTKPSWSQSRTKLQGKVFPKPSPNSHRCAASAARHELYF